MKSPRQFVYKITEDSGGAPCVKSKLLTLALCKPSIRRSAAIGDWVFAFVSNNERAVPTASLICVARITEKIENGKYHELNRFSKRDDCIYRRQKNAKFVRRSDAKFHVEEDLRVYDLGEPDDYCNAVALISADCRKRFKKRQKSERIAPSKKSLSIVSHGLLVVRNPNGVRRHPAAGLRSLTA